MPTAPTNPRTATLMDMSLRPAPSCSKPGHHEVQHNSAATGLDEAGHSQRPGDPLICVNDLHRPSHASMLGRESNPEVSESGSWHWKQAAACHIRATTSPPGRSVTGTGGVALDEATWEQTGRDVAQNDLLSSRS